MGIPRGGGPWGPMGPPRRTLGGPLGTHGTPPEALGGPLGTHGPPRGTHGGPRGPEFGDVRPRGLGRLMAECQMLKNQSGRAEIDKMKAGFEFSVKNYI